MDCCGYRCGWLSVIVAILAGVLLGVLYALGTVATGVLFWAYLLFGVLGLLLTPLYAGVQCRCFLRNRALLLAAGIGTVVTAAAGLLLAPVAGVVVLGIVVGLATAFVTLLLGAVVCLASCLCDC